MLPHLCSASSRLLASTCVQYGVRLTFSSSAACFVRRLPQRSAGERANFTAGGSELKESEDEVAENKPDRGEGEGEGKFDRWLLSGEEKANQSAIRPYKNAYGHFLKSVAPSFREPQPRNWLGHDVPFPLNPSFKPPIPLSDDLRTRLYHAYLTDPKLNSVRVLAARHNISIKRIDAILRLKGMEEAWKKGKPLQTGFTKGMERLLGVTEAAKRAKQDVNELPENTSHGSNPHDRYDAEEADLQDEVQGNDKARQRYQRLFWDSVAEGEEPVMPSILEAQCGTVSTRVKFKGETILVNRAPSRPAILFVDVGNAFIDERERARREQEGARRSMVRARRRKRNHHT